MRKHLFALLILLCAAVPSFAQHREPVATTMDANGKFLYIDFHESDLLAPEPQHVNIQKAVVFDFQCVPSQPNPPPGNDRFYCDSGTGQMVCKTSAGANCLGGGGGGGGGSVTSVGLAGPTGIPISNSPVTSTGTLTWSMPSGWVLGDLLIGNGNNSVARLAAPTTPNAVTEMLISTPSGGATQPAWALAGLPGRVVSTNSDTLTASDRTPQTIEYTFNGPTAITVPDPASTGFNGNPSFVTIAEGVGPYTFTPQTSAVIMYCDGSNCFDGQPALTLQKGQYATWSSPTTSNWVVRVASTQPISQPPVVNGLISGGGVTWTGLLNFTCSAAQYAIGGTVFNSPQTNLTLAAADPTNPRIDVIAVNNSGACVAITGTPAGSPAAPSVDPTTQLSLTFVTIPANATTPTLNSILVYDENSTPPTEYTCTPTSNFNCNSTNNPFHLTHDIEATTAVATNSVSLINSSAISYASYSTLSFNIRNKAAWAAAKSLQICFLNSATIVGNCIGFKNGVYGFNQTNISSYQQIVIPLSAFALGSTVADRIRFQVLGTGAGIGFYLDWIQIQSNLSGSGSTGFQLQVNGQNTQPTTNIADNASVTWSCTVAAGTTISTCKATAVGAGGYNQIDSNGTSVTQRSTLNFIPAGSANVSCIDNSGATRTDCTVTGINGPPSPTVQTISGSSYTILNSDNSWRDKFTNSGATAITLPQANTISASPYIGQKYSAVLTSCSSCTTATFSQSSGHALLVTVVWSSSSITLTGISDGSSDAHARIAPDFVNIGSGAYNASMWIFTNISAAGANSITATFSGTVGNAGIDVEEYNLASGVDNVAENTSTTGSSFSTTIPISYSSAIGFAIQAGSFAPAAGPGWRQYGNTFGGNSFGNFGFLATFDRLLSSVATSTFTSPGFGSAGGFMMQTDFAIAATPTFTNGWYVVLENAGNSLDTVTPTTSTINGQTTLVMVPNEACAVMSDGTNYDAFCWWQPNRQTNGVMGGIVEITGVNTAAAGADQGTTTLITTGAADSQYEVKGSIACHGATSTGTSTLTITYTDTSNTVQTSTVTAACTTLGSSSIGQVDPIFRAKASTNIQYGFAHGGTQPTVDVSVSVYQLSTK